MRNEGAMGLTGDRITDPVRYVREAAITVTYEDGSADRWLVNGRMRGRMASDYDKISTTLWFGFEDPSSVEQVEFDAPPAGEASDSD
jgi:hypothetical protein